MDTSTQLTLGDAKPASLPPSPRPPDLPTPLYSPGPKETRVRHGPGGNCCPSAREKGGAVKQPVDANPSAGAMPQADQVKDKVAQASSPLSHSPSQTPLCDESEGGKCCPATDSAKQEVDGITATGESWTVVKSRRARQQDRKKDTRASASGSSTESSTRSPRRKSRSSRSEKATSTSTAPDDEPPVPAYFRQARHCYEMGFLAEKQLRIISATPVQPRVPKPRLKPKLPIHCYFQSAPEKVKQKPR